MSYCAEIRERKLKDIALGAPSQPVTNKTVSYRHRQMTDRTVL